jgi:hypothetical protein
MVCETHVKEQLRFRESYGSMLDIEVTKIS